MQTFTGNGIDVNQLKLDRRKKLVKSQQVQNLPFVPEFEELLRFPSTFAFLASKQQIGVKRNNFSAARP